MEPEFHLQSLRLAFVAHTEQFSWQMTRWLCVCLFMKLLLTAKDVNISSVHFVRTVQYCTIGREHAANRQTQARNIV
jgi:hypothetical protein